MEEKIKQIRVKAEDEISKIETIHDLNEVKVKILGKKGELTEILRGMGNLSSEERPVIGNLVNKVRDEIEGLITSKET